MNEIDIFGDECTYRIMPISEELCEKILDSEFDQIELEELIEDNYDQIIFKDGIENIHSIEINGNPIEFEYEKINRNNGDIISLDMNVQYLVEQTIHTGCLLNGKLEDSFDINKVSIKISYIKLTERITKEMHNLESNIIFEHGETEERDIQFFIIDKNNELIDIN
jgi:hypothetical protein